VVNHAFTPQIGVIWSCPSLGTGSRGIISIPVHNRIRLSIEISKVCIPDCREIEEIHFVGLLAI
jgi:hypothetical protein